jgi:hypothetical protein
MNKSESIASLAKALAAAQGKLRKAVKDSTNPHFRSRYADLESVIEAMREPFAAEGLSVVQLTVGAELVTIILHSSGEWIESAVPLLLLKNDMQGVGSALTYARRYGLAAACGISQTDHDGNDACPAPKQSVKDINAEMVKRGAIEVPAPQLKSSIPCPRPAPKNEMVGMQAILDAPSKPQQRETAQDERDVITAAGGPTYSVGGVRQMQDLVESNEPYEYPKHRDLVVEAASQLKISKPRIAAHRDQLNQFLATAAYGNLESIKQAMQTYFSQQEQTK